MRRLLAASAVAAVVSLAGGLLRAQQPVTPWKVGDVFVGVGSFADDQGVYKTLSPTGTLKTDTSGVPVPDLVVDPANNSVDWTTDCTVDPTTDNGDLWTTAWATNTLAHFSADTHQPIDLFPFADPDSGLDTPLAAIARAAGVPALPRDVIGAAVDDPLTPIDETIPAIVSTEQIVFATDGQFFVGAGQPSQSSDLGLGHGYLLRFKYDAAATNKLTLTGWWQVDAGALADRSAIRAEILNDPTIDQHDPAAVDANQLLAAQYVDGTSNGATGADELDLSSDQHTIFYTSEDNFIRVFDISSAMGTSQSGQLPSIELTDENGNSMPLTRAYGVRALPGTWTDASTPQPADGSNGFLVATSDNIVYRVDRTGKVIARCPIPGRPAALSLSPDAQYFWTATTQDDPTLPTDNGGHVFRIRLADGERGRLAVRADHVLAGVGQRAPSGLTLNATTGVISGRLATNAAGNGSSTIYKITIVATSGSSSARDTFNWTVKDFPAGHHDGDGCGSQHHER